jgi:hypothetical protein
MRHIIGLQPLQNLNKKNKKDDTNVQLKSADDWYIKTLKMGVKNLECLRRR